jgi:hypothetical protein
MLKVVGFRGKGRRCDDGGVGWVEEEGVGERTQAS